MKNLSKIEREREKERSNEEETKEIKREREKYTNKERREDRRREKEERRENRAPMSIRGISWQVYQRTRSLPKPCRTIGSPQPCFEA